MKDKLIVALDVDHLEKAERLVKQLSGTVRIFKVGKELFTAAGPEAIRMVHRYEGKVFLDLKFHDIPNTVAGAVRSAASSGIFMCNVHTLGGREMLEGAVRALEAVSTEKAAGKPLLIGVTILTSMSDEALREIGILSHVEDEVLQLASLAKDCGLSGVVASGLEAPVIRKVCGKRFLIVTPGVRPAWAARGDQKRVLTPRQAMENGADFIVVGRPVIAAKNPVEAAQKILKEIS